MNNMSNLTDNNTIANSSDSACYKLPREIHGNLKITYDSARSTIVLWSKYQVIIYDEGDFGKNPIVVLLNFVAEKVFIHQNYLLCLDCTGNLNVLKIRNQSTEELSRTFSHTNTNILACEIIDTQYVASLQYKENTLKLLVNEFNLIFDYLNIFNIDFPDEILNDAREKNVMVSATIKPQILVQIKDTFNVKKCDLIHTLLVFSLDKINVYACVIRNMMNKVQNENIKLIKIFTNRYDVVDIKITITDEIYVLIGLAGGHIMKVRLSNLDNKPETYHLNTPLYKFIIIKHSVIYTDGLTMWTSEHLLSNTDTIHQFFVKNVRDFVVKNNQIICITFSNLLYTFFIDNKSSYILSEDNDSSCSVEVVMRSEFLSKIKEYVQKNEEQLKKINKESEYLTAIALSNRQDLMDSIIQVGVKVYDNYMDVIQENAELTLTDALNDYSDTQSYYFVLSLSLSAIQHKLKKLLSNVLGDIKLHITIFRNQVLKTTTIQVAENLMKKNFVISLKRNLLSTVSGVQVYVKIITNIPGQLDDHQRLWNVLYRKSLDIHSMQFIRTSCFTNCVCLKKDDDSLHTMINKLAEHTHGALYKFNHACNKTNQISLCLKLPHNYETILNNKLSYQNYLSSKKTDVLLHNCVKKLSMYNNMAELNVGDEKVILVMDKAKLTLKISCSDLTIASDMRNLIAQIVIPAFQNTTGKEFANFELYTNIENLKRAIQTHRNSNHKLIRLFADFQSLIFGSLPI